MERSIRWLDRCIAYHERSGQKETQSLFAIVQGGLEPELRARCLDEMIKRKDGVGGYAIGGLSGGEEKGKILPLKHSRPPDSYLLRRFLANVSQFLGSRTRLTFGMVQNQTMCRQPTRR